MDYQDEHNSSELSQILPEDEQDLSTHSLEDNEVTSLGNGLFNITPDNEHDNISLISDSISSSDITNHIHITHQVYSNVSISSKSSYISGRNTYISEPGELERSSLQMEHFFQQLNSFEEVLSKPALSSREIDLSFKHSVFTYIDSCGELLKVNFKLSQDLLQDEFITFKISCLPSVVVEEDFKSCRKKKLIPGVDFLKLNFRLFYSINAHQPVNNDNNLFPPRSQSSLLIPIKVSLFNGEYCISVVNGQKNILKAGNYSLLIQSQVEAPELDDLSSDDDSFSLSSESNTDFFPKLSEEPNNEKNHETIGTNHSQELQIQVSINKEVSTTTIAPHCIVRGVVGFNEMKYYKFVLRDPSKLVTIRLKPINSSGGSDELDFDENEFLSHDLNYQSEGLSSDVDLFISNQFDGMVPVTAENACWRDTSCGVKTIHIVPGDINLRRSNETKEETHSTSFAASSNTILTETFIIGLLGNSDVNNYELLVTIKDIPELISLSTKPVMKNIRASHSILPSYDLSPKQDYLGESITSFLISPGAPVKSRGEKQFTFNDTQNQSSKLKIILNKLYHYSIEINPSESGFVVFDLKLLKDHFSENNIWVNYSDIVTFASKKSIDLTFGNGVYPTLATPLDLFNDEDDDDSTKHMIVMYASNQYIYPDTTSHIWRAVGTPNSTSLIIRTNEWKHISNTCYVSFCVCDITKKEIESFYNEFNSIDFNSSRNTEYNSGLDYGDGIGTDMESCLEDFIDLIIYRKLRQQKLKDLSTSKSTEGLGITHIDIKWSLWTESDSTRIRKTSTGEAIKLQIFQDLFSSIDGSKLSYKDRDGPDFDKAFLFDNSHLNGTNTSLNEINFSFHKTQDHNLDDQTLAYFEIDYYNFFNFLIQCGAKDGDIFYDLGCGVGKAIISAALSGIKFKKILGVEVLPSLYECAKDVVLQFTSKTGPKLRRSQSASQSASAVFLQNTTSSLRDSISLRDSFSYQIGPLNDLHDKLNKVGIQIPEIFLK